MGVTAVEDRAEEGGREYGGAEDEEFMSKKSKRRVALRAEGGDADAEKDDAKATAAPTIQTWRKREFTTRKSAETPNVLHERKTHHRKYHSKHRRHFFALGADKFKFKFSARGRILGISLQRLLHGIGVLLLHRMLDTTFLPIIIPKKISLNVKWRHCCMRDAHLYCERTATSIVM